jgi:nicotinate phosphoribosyltransferase
MNISADGLARGCGGLFSDLYELTMLHAYNARRMNETAVFSLFVRAMPDCRNVLIACGLDELLDELEKFRFEQEDIAYLRSLAMIPNSLLDELYSFRFAGDVFAMPEGTPFFANEPILEIVAPIGQAQIIETLVLNQIGMQTTMASKALRVVSAASGRPVVDFGARRAQGFDAALKGARALAILGVSGTSLLAAGSRYHIPVMGTMAHSFVQAFTTELEAFDAFAKLYPRTVLLVDTYDSLQGVQNTIELARRIGADCRLTGIRLDSGDLDALSRAARALLDAAGLQQLKIVASGGLNELRIEALVKAGAPIDIFGVGSDMSVSADAPYLDIAYKLTEFAGSGRMKLSAHKSTMPGRKQVFRHYLDGVAVGDLIALRDETLNGKPLLEPAMRSGKRLRAPAADLSSLRVSAARMINEMPRALLALGGPVQGYPVAVSDRLRADTLALGARLGASGSHQIPESLSSTWSASAR